MSEEEINDNTKNEKDPLVEALVNMLKDIKDEIVSMNRSFNELKEDMNKKEKSEVEANSNDYNPTQDDIPGEYDVDPEFKKSLDLKKSLDDSGFSLIKSPSIHVDEQLNYEQISSEIPNIMGDVMNVVKDIDWNEFHGFANKYKKTK